MEAKGISTVGVLGLIFVTLKLTGVIKWSWWWVTLPFWGGFALIVFFFISYMILYWWSRKK